MLWPKLNWIKIDVPSWTQKSERAVEHWGRERGGGRVERPFDVRGSWKLFCRFYFFQCVAQRAKVDWNLLIAETGCMELFLCWGTCTKALEAWNEAKTFSWSVTATDQGFFSQPRRIPQKTFALLHGPRQLTVKNPMWQEKEYDAHHWAVARKASSAGILSENTESSFTHNHGALSRECVSENQLNLCRNRTCICFYQRLPGAKQQCVNIQITQLLPQLCRSCFTHFAWFRQTRLWHSKKEVKRKKKRKPRPFERKNRFGFRPFTGSRSAERYRRYWAAFKPADHIVEAESC